MWLLLQEAVAKVRDEAELSTPQTLTSPDLVDDTMTSGTNQKSESSAPPKSQMALLAGSIKTKRKRWGLFWEWPDPLSGLSWILWNGYM